MAKHGKRYVDGLAQIDREHHYTPREAVALIKGIPGTKFSETVEVHIRTGLNVRHAEEQPVSYTHLTLPTTPYV